MSRGRSLLTWLAPVVGANHTQQPAAHHHEQRTGAGTQSKAAQFPLRGRAGRKAPCWRKSRATSSLFKINGDLGIIDYCEWKKMQESTSERESQKTCLRGTWSCCTYLILGGAGSAPCGQCSKSHRPGTQKSPTGLGRGQS